MSTASPQSAPELRALAARVAKLSPEQKANFLRRLAARQQQQGKSLGAREIPRHEPADGRHPLSFAQERIWFIQQLAGHGALYNMPMLLWIDGPLDRAALRRAFATQLARHATLRTAIRQIDGAPAQVVLPQVPCRLPEIDLRGLPESRRKAVARDLAQAERQRPFDLARPPLFRMHLVRLADQRWLQVCVFHHLIGDGLSWMVSQPELWSFYRATLEATNGPLGAMASPAMATPAETVRYVDLATWQRQRFEGGELDTQLEGWRQRLAGAPETLELPTDRPRPSIQRFDGDRVLLQLPESLTGAVQALARDQGCTMFIALLTTLLVLLHRLTGQHDLSVGSNVAGRSHPATAGMIGCLINILVLRHDLRGATTFAALLDQARSGFLEAQSQQDLPFEKLVEDLRPGRSLSHTPLFQVSVNQVGRPLDGGEIPGCALRVERPHNQLSGFDLTLELGIVEAGRLDIFWEYASALFDRDTIERWSGHFETLLTQVVADPQLRLDQLELLTTAQRHQLLHQWSPTARVVDEPAVPHHVRRWIDERPDATVLVSGDTANPRRWTYRDLGQRVARLATALRRLGVGPATATRREPVVALVLPRSFDLLVGALATLEVGGAYLPLDPDNSLPRLRYTLGDAQPQVVLTERDRVNELADAVSVGNGDREDDGSGVTTIEALLSDTTEAEAEPLGPLTEPDSLAYVIYTSGSTGHPKGTELTHRGLVNLATWHRTTYTLGPDDRVLLLAGPGFDASVWETWACLTAGASLYVPDPVVLASPPDLLRWIADVGITVGFLPTPLAEAVLDVARTEAVSLPRLRALLTGGDQLRQRPPADGLELVNHYGPTENTVVATAGRVTPLDSQGTDATTRQLPSIGRPLTNVEVRVVDARLEPVPVGVAGDLLLGGVGLARGYRDRPTLTATSFVPDPLGSTPGARLYRTGDRVRWRADGRLLFLGRQDHQVKIRGQRIELGEIEATLEAQPVVAQAVVRLRTLGTDDTPVLVGYWVPRQGTPEEADAQHDTLRAALRDALPPAMVPALLHPLDRLPLNASGKVDTAALPEPRRTRRVTPASPPSNALEQRLAALWCEFLPVDVVGIDDNFFDLGGHSLLLTKVHHRLVAELGRPVPITRLFQHPTVRALAAHLAGEETTPAPQEAAEERAQRSRQARQQRRRRRPSGSATVGGMV